MRHELQRLQELHAENQLLVSENTRLQEALATATARTARLEKDLALANAAAAEATRACDRATQANLLLCDSITALGLDLPGLPRTEPSTGRPGVTLTMLRGGRA